MGSIEKSTKRLIVGCDGTWHSADTGPADDPSNITNICRALSYNGGKKNSIPQIVLYQPGVGTGNLGPVQHALSGGMGLGLEENSREAYAFIANNYSAGDEIFLFGFSRGAYTARSVAGLIGALGILTKDSMHHFKPIYALYQKATTPVAWDFSLADYITTNKLEDMGWRYEPKDVEIKVVGCWDTVGALGLPENKLSELLHLNDKWKFLDKQLPLRVEHAFHALALDEHRSSFYPTLWWLHPDAQWTRSTDGKVIKPEMVQCWFPGHHSDVGGGNPDHKIPNLSLVWMIDQCMSRGLLNFNVDFVKKFTADTRNSTDPSWTKNRDPFYSSFLPTILWSILGSRVRTPGRDPIPTGPNGVKPGSKTNEVIHFSVREKMEETAKPGAKTPLPAPSKAMEGYQWKPTSKAWFWTKDKKLALSEFPLPKVDDPNGLQAWLSSDWLQNQGGA